jgi:hypothetical protein
MAIMLRDSNGRQLARYGFTPRWTMEDTTLNRSVLSFAYRVPNLPGVARVDLVGPSGLLSSWTYTRDAPAVRITSPAGGATVTPKSGRVHVAWQGADADGNRLVYSVVYSADGGNSWSTEALQTNLTGIDVPLQAGATRHMIRVYVTDGGRSGVATASFKTK